MLNYMKVEMGLYALTTGLTKIQDFWNFTPCQLVNSYQHFGGDCCLHLQGYSSTREDREYGGSSYITVV